MTPAVGRQGLLLLTALVLGMGFGCLYDLGRGLRREKPGLTAPVDLAFALVWALGLFLVSVYTHGLRLYQLLGVGLGAALWFRGPGGVLLPLWRRCLRAGARLRRGLRRLLKKTGVFLRNFAKKRFPSGGKWGTISKVPYPFGRNRNGGAP